MSHMTRGVFQVDAVGEIGAGFETRKNEKSPHDLKVTGRHENDGPGSVPGSPERRRGYWACKFECSSLEVFGIPSAWPDSYPLPSCGHPPPYSTWEGNTDPLCGGGTDHYFQVRKKRKRKRKSVPSFQLRIRQQHPSSGKARGRPHPRHGHSRQCHPLHMRVLRSGSDLYYYWLELSLHILGSDCPIHRVGSPRYP
jgi:hypothetical protein